MIQAALPAALSSPAMKKELYCGESRSAMLLKVAIALRGA
jgi:hypothetical protein